jgi:hypothetical protein
MFYLLESNPIHPLILVNVELVFVLTVVLNLKLIVDAVVLVNMMMKAIHY